MLCIENNIDDATKNKIIKTRTNTHSKKKVINFYSGSSIIMKIFREKIKHITLYELKEECKKYGLKRTGRKCELFDRLCELYEKINSCIFIQKIGRGYIARKYVVFRSKKNYNIVNETDFYSFEDLSDIPDYQKYYLTCNRGYTYAFDIKSLYKLYKQGKKDKRKSEILNPYTRERISSQDISLFKRFIKLSKCLKYKIQLKDEVDTKKENEREQDTIDTIHHNDIPSRIRELFYTIDEFGYITDPMWFLDLNRDKLIQLIREIYDIWCYRANPPQSVKNQIIYPNGRISESLNLRLIYTMNFEELQKTAYFMLKRLITKGINESSRHLGVIYSLTGLTMVSTDAAHSLPYLYQSTLNT